LSSAASAAAIAFFSAVKKSDRDSGAGAPAVDCSNAMKMNARV